MLVRINSYWLIKNLTVSLCNVYDLTPGTMKSMERQPGCCPKPLKMSPNFSDSHQEEILIIIITSYYYKPRERAVCFLISRVWIVTCYCENCRVSTVNPLTPELNPSTQRCLTRFSTGDFVSWTVHFVNICVKNQQIHQLFIHFINYVW
jgi:hypothetical protein